MVQHYFDAHVYVANWMSAVFMLRLPIDALPQETVDAFKVSYILEFERTQTHWVVKWSLEDSENYERFGEESGEGWMSRLIGIRDELLRGDIRSLYIGWLATLYPGTADADQMEPLPINGLGEFTACQQALAEFLEVDPDLLIGPGWAGTNFGMKRCPQQTWKNGLMICRKRKSGPLFCRFWRERVPRRKGGKK